MTWLTVGGERESFTATSCSPAVSPASARQTVSRLQPASGVCPGEAAPRPRRGPAGRARCRRPAPPSPAGSFPRAALTPGGLRERKTKSLVGTPQVSLDQTFPNLRTPSLKSENLTTQNKCSVLACIRLYLIRWLVCPLKG